MNQSSKAICISEEGDYIPIASRPTKGRLQRVYIRGAGGGGFVSGPNAPGMNAAQAVRARRNDLAPQASGSGAFRGPNHDRAGVVPPAVDRA